MHLQLKERSNVAQIGSNNQRSKLSKLLPTPGQVGAGQVCPKLGFADYRRQNIEARDQTMAGRFVEGTPQLGAERRGADRPLTHIQVVILFNLYFQADLSFSFLSV